jgi:hypothetical protein
MTIASLRRKSGKIRFVGDEATDATDVAASSWSGPAPAPIGAPDKPRPQIAAVVWIGLGLLAFAALATFLLWPVPHWLTDGSTNRIKDADDARLPIATALVGFVSAGGLLANFVQARRSAEKAHALAESNQVTDRYSKAIEQIGTSQLHIRLGGIFALERIARDSIRDRPTVVEVLAAFCRHPPEETRTVAPDVQAAVTVLGRMPQPRGARIDLAGANLRDAQLQNADLRGAWLRGTLLQRASLSSAHLEGAHFYDANLDEAFLFDTHLEGAVLGWTSLDVDIVNAPSLRGTKMWEAHLDGAYLAGWDPTTVSGLTQEMLEVAVGHQQNPLPDGLVPPVSWSP